MVLGNNQDVTTEQPIQLFRIFMDSLENYNVIFALFGLNYLYFTLVSTIEISWQ